MRDHDFEVLRAAKQRIGTAYAKACDVPGARICTLTSARLRSRMRMALTYADAAGAGKPSAPFGGQRCAARRKAQPAMICKKTMAHQSSSTSMFHHGKKGPPMSPQGTVAPSRDFHCLCPQKRGGIALLKSAVPDLRMT